MSSYNKNRSTRLRTETLEDRVVPAGLLGEYFNNPDLSDPAGTRVDAQVDFDDNDFGNGPPGTSVTADDTYSERWTGWVKIDSPGTWTFSTVSNDGVRLWVNNQPLIDNWEQHTATVDQGSIQLEAGWHPLRLEHFQQNGTVVIQLRFAGPDQPEVVIPTTHLSPTDPNDGTPVANAGPDRSVEVGNPATLSGSGIDNDGSIVSYSWQQISGPNQATLENDDTAEVDLFGLASGTYTLELTVTDDDGQTDSDTVDLFAYEASGDTQISGELKVWHATTLTFDGPELEEASGPNPFLDYRLSVEFVGPSGQRYQVPGYFAANGDAGNTHATKGNKWRVNFAADEAGEWSYVASFRTGSNVAIDLDANAGTPTAFDGTNGAFTIAQSDKTGDDFRAPDKGLIKNRGDFYLTYASGDPFVKIGPDIPENFFGYEGFDNTPNAGHDFDGHVGDWNPGDPDWDSDDADNVADDGRGIIGAINYIAEQGGNSIYFLPMNIGGDGKDTFPTIAEQNKTRYDVSKLDQWEVVFAHAQSKGVLLHFVLAETESGNENYHDNGNLGTQRKLYYRELIARFGHHPGIQFNLGEENDYGATKHRQFASYLKAVDPYDHPVTTHTKGGQYDNFYNPLLGNGDIDMTSFQGGNSRTSMANLISDWRERSDDAGVRWAISFDEPQKIENDKNDEAKGYPHGRRDKMWPALMSGGGGFEWYVQQDGGGHSFDQQIDDFSMMDVALQWMGHARTFLTGLPLLEMSPNHSLGDSGAGDNTYVLQQTGETYAMYNDRNGEDWTLDLTGVNGEFEVRWFDPRYGGGMQTGTVTSVTGGSIVSLGDAPNTLSNDWAAVVKLVNADVDMREPDNPGSTVRGLRYNYFEGTWDNLPDFDGMNPTGTGLVNNFDMTPRQQDDAFGFRFTGYINVPADGMYTFFTNSDDGSRVYIGDQMVVNNDGLHSAQEASGSIGLKAGMHAIKVDYFDRSGSEFLEVRWQSNGLAKQRITDGVLATEAPTTGIIEGSIWVDENGDGVFDAGEQPQAGVTVYLDLNGNSQRDSNEPSQTTADGTYTFTGLAPGSYIVAQEVPVGFTQTFPTSDVREVVGTERVAAGLDSPLFVTAPPGDQDRLFILEKASGQVKILNLADGSINPSPFLTITDLSTDSEQGLLGLAFDPNYDTNGYFYVSYTDATGTAVKSRFQVSQTNPDIADPTSELILLKIPQPQANHNGGWLGFGPDGYLYLSSGDGGGSNDQGTGHTDGIGNAQDITDNLLGKMLRIDVRGDDFPNDPDRNYAIPADNPFVGITGDDEIWSYGLRNPWRASFDRVTGDLYIGDVGQGAREEIDFQPANVGGANYGWRFREGDIQTPGGVGGPEPADYVASLYSYSHGSGAFQGRSVTGGYVYRGPIQALQGKYFFADFVSSRIWSIEHDGSNVTELLDWTAALTPDVNEINNIASFGEDAAGNLYIVDFGGEIFRIVPTGSVSVHGVTLSEGETVSGLNFGNEPEAVAQTATVGFDTASAEIDESVGNVTTNVTLTTSDGAALQNDLTVEVQVVGGTAGDDDYQLNTTTVTFLAGTLSGATSPVTLAINDDANDEPDETVVLGLTNPTGGQVGTPAQYTLTILDNDEAEVQTATVGFDTASAEVDESVGNVTTNVTLTTSDGAALQNDLTVEVQVVGGTAGDDDYQLNTTTVTFLAGTLSGATSPVTLAINDDANDEPDETVVLGLTNPTGGQVGTPAQYTLTILDNDESDPPPTQQPFDIAPVLRDGTRIQAENFDRGGQGIAYSDSDVSNNGGEYRPDEGVDIQSTTDTGGGFNISWIEDGEYLEYTLAEIEAGVYDILARVAASGNNPGDLRLLIGDGPDGTNFTELGTFDIESTGGAQQWVTLTLENIDLSPLTGQNKMLRLESIGGSFNINWIELVTSVNEAPTVNAGADTSITLPTNTVNLTGSVSDDGLPNDGLLSTVWTVESGAGTVTFADANAINTSARFNAPGVYTLRLTADDGDQQAFDEVVITVNREQVSGVIGETGTITIDEQSDSDEWHKVEFTNTFVNPIVMVGPPSFTGPQPTTVRVRNVTPTGFEFQLDEWEYLDGFHLSETLGWLVVEAGTHTLADGTVIHAAAHSVDHNWTPVSMNGAFGSNPVVLTQVASVNENIAVTTRARNVSADGVELRLQEQELFDRGSEKPHVAETVNLIAIETGSGSNNGLSFLASTTPDEVRHRNYNIEFSATLSSPILFAAMQTTDGGDPATLRYRRLDGDGATIFIQEDRSLDRETWHTTEVVGYLAFGGAGTLIGQTGSRESFQPDPSSANLLSIDATSFDRNTSQGNHTWTQVDDRDAIGGSAMLAGPDTDTNNNTGFVSNSPRLDYRVNFVTPGIYYVWILGRADTTSPSGMNDSVHVGLDGKAVDTADRISGFGNSFGWSRSTMDGSMATVEVAESGVRTLNVWMREDGFVFDKIVLTTDPDFIPSGEGPDESSRA